MATQTESLLSAWKPLDFRKPDVVRNQKKKISKYQNIKTSKHHQYVI